MKPTPNEIAIVANAIGRIYGHLEEEIIQLIVKRMIEGPPTGPMDAGRWQVERILARPGFKEDVTRIIIKNTRTVPAQIRKELQAMAEKAGDIVSKTVLQEALDRGLISALPEPGLSRTAASRIQRLFDQAISAHNLVNTSLLTSAEQQYLDILNKAAGLVATGESPHSAIKIATKDLIKNGLTGFTDTAGRRWEPQSAVERIIRTTWNNAANESAFARVYDLGVDTILVSAHLGARPKCSLVQGKIFSLSGETQSVTDKHGASHAVGDWNNTSYGEPDGILGINCRHHIMPFFDGLTEQVHEPIDEDLNREYYKQEQKQRRLERELRHIKRQRQAATAMGDKDGARAANLAAKSKTQQLIQHIKDYKLERSKVRERP